MRQQFCKPEEEKDIQEIFRELSVKAEFVEKKHDGCRRFRGQRFFPAYVYVYRSIGRWRCTTGGCHVSRHIPFAAQAVLGSTRMVLKPVCIPGALRIWSVPRRHNNRSGCQLRAKRYARCCHPRDPCLYRKVEGDEQNKTHKRDSPGDYSPYVLYSADAHALY